MRRAGVAALASELFIANGSLCGFFDGHASRLVILGNSPQGRHLSEVRNEDFPGRVRERRFPIAEKARHTDVTIPPITSLLRPVAFTAARNAGSSQAFMEDRSMSLTSGSAALSDAIVGLLTRISTPTVLKTTGILKARAAVARVRALSSTTLRSCSKTRSSTFS